MCVLDIYKWPIVQTQWHIVLNNPYFCCRQIQWFIVLNSSILCNGCHGEKTIHGTYTITNCSKQLKYLSKTYNDTLSPLTYATTHCSRQTDSLCYSLSVCLRQIQCKSILSNDLGQSFHPIWRNMDRHFCPIWMYPIWSMVSIVYSLL